MYILCSVIGFQYTEIQRFDNYYSALRGYYHIIKVYPDEKFVILKNI